MPRKQPTEDTVLCAFREVESSLVAVDREQEQVSDLKRLSASARETAAIARAIMSEAFLIN